MTQIFQAMGMGLPGTLSGNLKPLANTGMAADPQVLDTQLEQLAQELGLNLEEISPEVLAALEQWLMGGMVLPPLGNGVPGEATTLPQGEDFAQVLSQSFSSSEKGGEAVIWKPGEMASLQTGGPELVKTPLAQSVLAALQNAAPAEETLTTLSTPNQAMVLAAKPAGAPGFSSALANNLLSMNVPQPVGTNGWGQAMGERLLWMVKGDQQLAELKISPPNLGPLSVKLTINNDQASVAFLSNHAAVRDALEAAIPRLREMLAQESLDLVNVDVGSNQGQAETRHHSGTGSGGTQSGEAVNGREDENLVGSGVASGAAEGLVDLFV